MLNSVTALAKRLLEKTEQQKLSWKPIPGGEGYQVNVAVNLFSGFTIRLRADGYSNHVTRFTLEVVNNKDESVILTESETASQVFRPNNGENPIATLYMMVHDMFTAVRHDAIDRVMNFLDGIK